MGGLMMAKRVFVASLVCLFLLACARIKGSSKEERFIDVTYKVLVSSAIAYDNAMNALADLYYDGYISEETKQEAMKVAFLYWTSYHAAVDLLEKYSETRDELLREELNTEIDKMNGHLQNLEAYVDEAKVN
jgi:hypothetical protein